MKTAVFIPPLKAVSGGVAVLLQVAHRLRESGRDALLVLRDQAKPPQGFDPGPVPVLGWNDLSLTPDDIWLIPEGWANALLPGLKARARCLLYVQNWAYLFSSLPPGLDLAQLARDGALEFLAVSAPVGHFVEQTLDLSEPCPILRPGIDRALFHPPSEGRPEKPLTVAWMPRKNKALGQQIIRIVETRRARAGLPPARFLPIEGKTPTEVAKLLRQAHVFLATGFPEGCPLPPLEAMASGCLVLGFAGFGGFDYMRSPARPDMPYLARGWTPERDPDEATDRTWGPNGLFLADGDVLGAALALGQALDRALAWGPGHEEWLALVREAEITAEAYDLARQNENILRLWSTLGNP